MKMMPPAQTKGYTVGRESDQDYPSVFGSEVAKVEELVRSGRISKKDAQMLLGILAKRASADMKREIDNLVSEGQTSKMLFLRYSWHG